jgi:hypothetical protein
MTDRKQNFSGIRSVRRGGGCGAFLAMLILLAGSAFAQPQISGNLSGTLGPGNYLVVGNCFIQAGNTLTIAPGTTLLHSGAYTWTVYGQLNAVGTTSDSIIFKRQSPSGERWGGIRIMEGSSANTLLSYCVIESCQNTSGGGLQIRSVPVTVRHSRISDCIGNYPGGGGIYVLSADALIDHCLIVNNNAPSGGNGGGIALENCSGVQVTNCEVAYNTDTGS